MLILYTTEDGKSQITLRADQQTVWLPQLEMAELFDATKQNISLRLKNLIDGGGLDPAATVKESLTVAIEQGRQPTTAEYSMVASEPPQRTTMKDISEAQNPDLRASVAAMHRAAELARKIAIQTDTNLVIMKDGQIIRIPAEALRARSSP